MQTPALPPGDPHRRTDEPVPPTDDAAESVPAVPDGPSRIVRNPAPTTDAPADEDVLVDLFGGDGPRVSDDSPTVITKNPPKPLNETVADKAAAESLRGRRLAHFELLEPIGVGGMAAVIRARDTQLDRTVALKILPPEMAADPENVRRFHQEARSAAKLDHENIARVFYCGEDQNLHFIGFEFVEGENLRHLLERRGRLPVAEALHYMLQIASGLAHAAARGVVHRDIKPSNIIVSPDGRAKLVDMGLARMSETHIDEGLTHSGVTLGTFDYISPEQALEPRDADVRSDIYSLGCTFYHVLTGLAPVPEGTAAKKLHHHQNEAPVDPRQLNPEISDDVAAILARMMAKDPKVRYQRAEHLVQHLALTLQKMGPADSLRVEPESAHGARFLDPPLPEPPRTRPLLVAGLAAMILLIVISFFGRPGKAPVWDVGQRRPSQDSGNHAPDKPRDVEPRPAPRNDFPNPVESVGVDGPREIASANEYVEYARAKRSPDSDVEIVLTAQSYEFPLTVDGEIVPIPSLVGRRVTIKGNPQNKPTIRFTYDVDKLRQLGPGTSAGWLGLSIESNDVTIENVRFVLDGRLGQKGQMAGVSLRGRENVAAAGAGSFALRNCDFVQAGQPPNLKANRPSSIVVTSSNKAMRPRLTLEDCYFVGFERSAEDKFTNVKFGGQDAISLKTPTDVIATNCAFGPHYALFRIEPDSERSEVTLRHCAALLVGDSAAFHAAGEKTTCSLNVGHSWFAGLNAPPPLDQRDDKGAALLRQDGVDRSTITYQGKDNRFHGLDAIWEQPNAVEPVPFRKLEQFRERNLEQDSLELTENLKFWKEGDPLAWLERGEPAKAFQVNDRLRELRSDDGKRLVGLTHWGEQIVFAPAEDLPAVARKILIVDPALESREGKTYKKLTGAFADIDENEDVEIQLRFNGLKEMTPVVVDKRIKVTLRPVPGFRPILTVARSQDLHSFLFRVLDGEVTLEDLEIRVQPGDANLKSQAVAGLVGDGRCTFKKCVITLDPAGKAVPVAVAAVSDPEAFQMMRDPPVPQAALKGTRLVFENCLVRGNGDLIACHASRPFEADLTNVWAAMSGAFLNCDPARDDSAPRPDADQPTQLRLKQVTAYLVGYLVRVRAGREVGTETKVSFKSVTPVRVDSANCIFQSAGGKSLVHLEGPDPGDDLMKTLIQWSAASNSYGTFDTMLDNQPLDDSMPHRPVGRIEWSSYKGESNPQIVQMPVLTAARSDLPLTSLLPESFRIKSDVPPARGAVAEALPRPYSEAGSRSE
jgi:serine/threonine protein kinase